MQTNRHGPGMLLLALVWGLLGSPARGAEYFVATNGLDSNGGTDWSAPLLTISNAVAKSDATVVTVSNGTYNITSQIVVGAAITVRSYGGGVYGGLANASNTVVQYTGAKLETGPRIFAVTNANAVLDGFTLRGGIGRGDRSGDPALAYWNGNGVYMTNGCAVMNCIIKENGIGGDNSHVRGGGVYMVGGTLSNCVVRGNITSYGGTSGGGGVYAVGGTIVNCQIAVNSCNGSLGGGGIYAANAQVLNCQILSNTNIGSTHGGGINANSASTLIRNCLIVSNRTTAASIYGGGVYSGRIESSTVVDNSAANASGTSGGGVYGSVVTNSIVWNNTTGSGSSPNYDPTSAFAYSCSSPQPPGASNVNSATFMNLAGGDYRLMPCPAVDSGTNLVWMAGALDLAGNPRTNGVNNRVDMGAYERMPGALLCGLAADVQSVLAPSNVVFTAFLDGTNKNITSYNWNFGDGQTASGATLSSVTNTYSAAGLYTVTLAVTNDTGESAAGTNANYIVVYGTNLYVWTNSPSPATPYHTWNNAARTIAAAVNAAPAGTTVIVTNGTYNTANQIVVGKAITVRSFGNGVYGGLANASNTVVQRDPALAISSPLRVFAVTNAGIVLDGFTIRNGLGRGDSGCNGNGVFMTNGSTVMNCIIKENGNQASGDTSWLKGGGVHMVGGTLSNCLVVANKPTVNATGGGIWADGGQILNCTIVSNSCPGGISSIGGGGIVANAASVLIRNCLIAGNSVTAAYSGGGVYLNSGRIESSTIVTNSAPAGAYVGGVHVVSGGITNSIVYFNMTGAIHSNLNITAGLAYSCSTNGGTAANGNIMSDPLFVNAAAGDYRLSAAPVRSPCLDAGSSAVVTWAKDLDGGTRIRSVAVDMGAYELVLSEGILFMFL